MIRIWMRNSKKDFWIWIRIRIRMHKPVYNEAKCPQIEIKPLYATYNELYMQIMNI